MYLYHIGNQGNILAVVDPDAYPSVKYMIKNIKGWLEKWENIPEEYSLSKKGFLLKVNNIHYFIYSYIMIR